MSFFEMLQDLFILIDGNKQIDLGLGDGSEHLQHQKMFLDNIFNIFLCSVTYNAFVKSDIGNKDSSILINNNQNGSKENVNIENVQKKSTRRIIMTGLNSNLNNSHRIQLSASRQGSARKDFIKTLYDVCFDLCISIILKMLETDENDINYDLAILVVASFSKHLRFHAQTSKIQNCVPSILALDKIFQHSKHILNVAKDKDLISKLFGVLHIYFKEETKNVNLNKNNNINLNQLIIGQGNQRQENQQLPQLQSNISQKQHSVVNNDRIKNEEKKTDDIYKKKLSFIRAASEPPSANKNAVMPIKQDYTGYQQEEGQLIDNLGIIDEKITLPLNQANSQQYQTQNNKIQIPLLQIDKSQQRTSSQNNQNTSTTVMTNYFNMPLGQFNTTQIQNQAQKNFKLGVFAQNTLAKSRLTRRQMSMSRKHTQKLSSMTNLVLSGNIGEERDTRNNNDYFGGDNTVKAKEINSALIQKKGPSIPKLNINQIAQDNGLASHKVEPISGIYTTTHAQQNKSSNRSNQVSSYEAHQDNQFGAYTKLVNLNNNYQNNNNVQKSSAQHAVESEQNNSMYDDGNGSFLLDDGYGLGDVQEEFLYNNAEEKLRTLALQLGESCLTNDLAALISQKRDKELAESAKKTANYKQKDFNLAMIQQQKQLKGKAVQRSISVTYNQSFLGMQQNASVSKFQPSSVRTQDKDVLPNLAQQKQARLILLNIICVLIKQYDIEEARFLRQPIHLLTAYLGSNRFKENRSRRQIKALEAGIEQSFHKSQHYIDTDDQYVNNLIDMTCNGVPQYYCKTDYQPLQQIKEDTYRNEHKIDESNSSTVSIAQNIDIPNEMMVFGIILENKGQFSTSQKMNLIINKNIYKSQLKPEERVIFKLLQKFSFVNEDILKKQVLNDLAHFASKDKGIDAKFYNSQISTKFNPNGSFLNAQIPPMPAPLSSTPIKHINNMSFDEDNEDFYFKKEKIGDAIQQIQNPKTLWVNNGIAYDLNNTNSSKSTSTSVSKEKIRKKLDTLLYTIDRRIKYALQQNFDKTSYQFADALLTEVITLSSYINDSKSRTMIHQIIEVNLESILMIKKCLIDITLKTNIFIMDFSKIQTPQDIVVSAGLDLNSPHHIDFLTQNNIQQIENQKRHRHLFSEFLCLLSEILLMNQTADTLKLINEVLINDEQWQESIKTYTISLFLQDIVGTINYYDQGDYIQQIIEELRGINILNFDEPIFMAQLMSCGDLNIYKQAKESIHTSILCSLNIMRYFSSITLFYQHVIQLYFSKYQTHYKSKFQAEYNNNASQAKEGQQYKSKKDFNEQEKKYDDPQAAPDQKQRKYWKQVIRKILYQYMFLITPPNGLLSQYLQNNAINYVNLAPEQDVEQYLVSPILRQKHCLDINAPCPVNFQLTLSVLNFMKVIFEIPDRFTKYVFIEELMLFYIRTHYISFVRLYNKNFQKNISSNKELSLTLCKKHLECLFAIAKNRNEDSRRKLYQFKIVQFLCQEIQLEYEVSQRRQKFLQVSKEEKEKILQAQDEYKSHVQTTTKIQMPPLKIAGLGLSELQQDNQEQKQDTFQFNQSNEGQQQTQEQQKKKFIMPPLKIAGLGLSELQQDNQEQKQEIVQANQSNENQLQTQELQKKKFSMPPLKIAGLGLTGLKLDTNEPNNTQNQQQENYSEQLDVQNQQQKTQHLLQENQFNRMDNSNQTQNQITEQQNDQQSKKPKMQLLNLTGLGLSTLVKDKDEPLQNYNNDNKYSDQSSAVQQYNETQVQKVQQQENLSHEQNNQQPPQNIPIKSKIPPLKIGGLGLSTLIKPTDDDHQTPEISQQQPFLVNTPPQQTKLPFKAPILNLDGIGHSTLVKDDNDEKPVMDTQPVVQQTQKPPMKITMPKLNIKGLTLSTLQKEPTQREDQNINASFKQDKSINISSQQEETKQETQFIQKPSLKINIPPIKVKGLGLTGIIPDQDIENKTIDPNSTKEQLFNKQKTNFDKTAPIKNQAVEDFQDEPMNQNLATQQNLKKILMSNEQKHEPQNVKESLESAQVISKANNYNKSIYVPQDQIDDAMKQKLNQQRKNLIPKKKNLINSVSNQSQISVDDYQQNEQQNAGARQFLLSNKSAVSQLKIESVIDVNDSNKVSPKNRSKSSISNMLSNYQANSNFAQTPNQNSGRSTGSFVGRNKIYVPFLKFPDDINADPSEKVTIYQKPDEARFKLAKTKDSVGKTPDKDISQASVSSTTNKPKILGKRGKLLDLAGVSRDSQDVPEDKVNKSESCAKPVVMIGQQEKHFSFKDDIIRAQLLRKRTAKDESNNNQQQPSQGEEEKAEQSVEQKQQPIKKPIVPSLNIPPKSEQPEGKQKIKQQIEESSFISNTEVGNLTKLEQSLNQNNHKFQLLLDKQVNEKDAFKKLGGKNLSIVRDDSLNHEILMSESMFYMKERSVRPIYQDEDLHVLMLSLMICLLLKPERGTLDDLYCSQFPIDNGKQNILFLLHFHINHLENQHIVPKLLKKEATISPPLAGQRLLKLLCTQLFDISMYNGGKEWKKLAEGAYAKVYQCTTNLSEPQSVAIKQMQLPNSIYDRCVLHDIFTEITCLEEFRLEPCVTDLFDYGVDKTCYYIVQKKYACSLREWRIKQKKELQIENLSLYLSIYKEILKALSTIHSHNVTHYDLKCDNILIDLGSNNNIDQPNRLGNAEDEKIRITIGDFGECKIFSNDKDELCNRNRGTDYIKSPEMLELTINTRKDTDKYDRRKQVGTNRLSDVWSIGCLFYELLTGEYLFQEEDYIQSFLRITRASEQLFTNDKLALINNNIYLIDFLKYSLVRDQRMRPSIDNLLKRFEHVHALLVSTSSSNSRFNMTSPNNYSIRGASSFEAILEQAQKIMIQNSTVFGGEIKEENGQAADFEHQLDPSSESQQNYEILGKNMDTQNGPVQPHLPLMMRIMEDVFLSSNFWLKHKVKKAIKMGITHVIIEEKYLTQSLQDKFDVLVISEYSDFINHPTSSIKINPFLLMPAAMDFLRKVALQHGRVLFVESHFEMIEGKSNSRGVKCQLIRECLLICMNAIYQTNAYETYTLIKSQNLFFKISSERLATISKWSLLTSKITQYMMTFPRFTCLCGSCVIIVKRQFANYSNMQSISCTCNQFYKNLETSQCPSPGCMEFTHYMKAFFQIHYDSLHWGFLEDDDFVLGPNYIGQYQNAQQRQLQSFISQTLDKNCDVVSIIEKKSSQSYNKDLIMQDYNMISKSSATAKNYHHPSYARWKLFKCSQCHVWTHAYNENAGNYAILLNNRVKEAKNNIGLLNQRQSGSNDGVRVPILQKVKLKIPF